MDKKLDLMSLFEVIYFIFVLTMYKYFSQIIIILVMHLYEGSYQ